MIEQIDYKAFAETHGKKIAAHSRAEMAIIDMALDMAKKINEIIKYLEDNHGQKSEERQNDGGADAGIAEPKRRGRPAKNEEV